MHLFPLLKSYIRQDKSVVLAVVVRGPEAWLGLKALIPAEGEPNGHLLETPLREQVIQDGLVKLSQAVSTTRRYDDPPVEVFFDIYLPRPKLIVVGGVHIASDLIYLAMPLGLRSYIVDPRTAFATTERFPHADKIIHAWPDEALPDIGLTAETNVVVVTHDPKLDDPALKVALPSPARYVGALGSPQTQAKRVKRLLAAGLTQAQINRLHAPIGLAIGGRTPAEIALSIIAEIVASRNNVSLVKRKP